ncbi:MAG: ATPase domain-containing protein [Salinirussus sp.]
MERLPTGIDGLDAVLRGGFIAGRSYMLHGPAGAGKTIVGLHFLDACEADETGLFVNLEEDIDDLRANAAALGFDTDAVEFLDLSPGAEVFTEDQSYEVFSASEIEQEPLTEQVTEAVRATEPDRVVVDPLTQFRYVIDDDYQFRKQIVGFMRFLKRQGATVLFTVQETDDLPTDDLQFISDGYVSLAVAGDRREVRVPKFRGSATRSGDHAFRITDDGIEVYPALIPERHERSFAVETLSSGIDEVDDLLYGGLERGTVTVVSGPTGVGKTTLGTQFAREAARRDDQSIVYLFEESRETYLARSEAIGLPVGEMIDAGLLRLEEVEPLALSPQEFASAVRDDVAAGTEMVMIDGLAGYRLLVRDEDDLLRRLHALGRYLRNVGATTILVDETTDVVGQFRATEREVSYLADTVVFLRHLELRGELRKAIGVLKKRASDYERTLREFAITGDGIEVGEPLTDLRGVLSGTPEFVDEE